MSVIPTQPQALPSTGRLLKATAVAVVVAAVVLVTTVLPAEYGIDPTGIGTRLGLNVLRAPEDAGASDVAARVGGTDRDATAAANAQAAFGAADGQSFATEATSPAAGPIRQDALTVELAPGKGSEVKALLRQGEGLTYHWAASGDVAVDMHGERPGVKNAWTSYAVEKARREGSGTFVAPFDGTHGWYWLNKGNTPVVVKISVAGFQPRLYRP